MGAKLGAIPCGRLWTRVDVYGIETLSFRAVWTAVDGRGHRLEIYGSEGWDSSPSGRASEVLAPQGLCIEEDSCTV